MPQAGAGTAPFVAAEGKPGQAVGGSSRAELGAAFPSTFLLDRAWAGTSSPALCYCSLHVPAWPGRCSQLDFLHIQVTFFLSKLFGVTRGRLTRKAFHGRSVILQLPSQPGQGICRDTAGKYLLADSRLRP